MYKNSFVMCVLSGGNVLQEENRIVKLPFNTDYKVRLINKNSKRSACDLFINGEKISRFILSSYETLDVERFLDGNLDNGSKFKFVSLEDSRVKSRKDFENGLVEAHFYLEKDKKYEFPIFPKCPYEPFVPMPYYKLWKPYDPWIIYDNSITFSQVDCNTTLTYSNIGTKGLCASNIVAHNSSIDGDTVRGEKSEQKFQNVSSFELEAKPTIFKLKLVQGSLQKMLKYCSNCRRKIRNGENYCPICGKKM